ncbi:MAG: hypothetical protein ACE5GM_00530 [bacterium]
MSVRFRPPAPFKIKELACYYCRAPFFSEFQKGAGRYHSNLLIKLIKEVTMTWEKDALAGKKGLIYSAIILASLYMISLLLAYNTYKEGIKGFDHLVSHIIPPYINTPELIPKETKKAIQAAFPWAVLVFITLYTSLVTLWRKRRDNFLSFSHYALLFLLQALIINIFFFSSNRHTLIVLIL